jgi:hypothetical protein
VLSAFGCGHPRFDLAVIDYHFPRFSASAAGNNNALAYRAITNGEHLLIADGAEIPRLPLYQLYHVSTFPAHIWRTT